MYSILRNSPLLEYSTVPGLKYYRVHKACESLGAFFFLKKSLLLPLKKRHEPDSLASHQAVLSVDDDIPQDIHPAPGASLTCMIRRE